MAGAVTWVLLGTCVLAGLNMMRWMGVLHGWIADADGFYQPGPRMRHAQLRKALKSTGIWLLTITAVMAWMSATHGLNAFSGAYATGFMGLGFTFKPEIWMPWYPFVSVSDYDEPIGPEPDPIPHLRSPEALEEWLDEPEPLDDDFNEACLEGEHEYCYQFGSTTGICMHCGHEEGWKP